MAEPPLIDPQHPIDLKKLKDPEMRKIAEYFNKGGQPVPLPRPPFLAEEWPGTREYEAAQKRAQKQAEEKWQQGQVQRWRKANGGQLPTEEPVNPRTTVVLHWAGLGANVHYLPRDHGVILRHDDPAKKLWGIRATLNAPDSEIRFKNGAVTIRDPLGKELHLERLPQAPMGVEGSPCGGLFEVKGNRRGIRIHVEDSFPDEDPLTLRIFSPDAKVELAGARHATIDHLPAGKTTLRIPVSREEAPWFHVEDKEWRLGRHVKLRNPSFGQDVDLVLYDPRRPQRSITIPVENGHMPESAMLIDALAGTHIRGKWKYRDDRSLQELAELPEIKPIAQALKNAKPPQGSREFALKLLLEYEPNAYRANVAIRAITKQFMKESHILNVAAEAITKQFTEASQILHRAAPKAPPAKQPSPFLQ